MRKHRLGKYWFLILAMAAAPALGGCVMCQEVVPTGWVGIRQTKDGIEKKILQPGHHMVWGRDKLILLETQESLFEAKDMQIQCKDMMNVSLDLQVRSRLRLDTDTIVDVLKAKGSLIKWKDSVGKLHYNDIEKTFLRRQAEAIARTVIGSKYKTTQVRENREAIRQEIKKMLAEQLKGTPVELRDVIVGNVDPPKVVRDAINKARKREIEIETERAEQAKKKLKEENRQKLAMLNEKNHQAMKMLKAENAIALSKKRKVVAAIDAEREAIRMQILGKAANASYFHLLRLENQRILYEQRRGATIVTNGNKVSPIVGQLR